MFGVPSQWPHVEEVLRGAGFVPGSRIELVFLADVGALQRVPSPLPGLHSERTVGVTGTRISALQGGARLGFVEVDLRLGDVGRVPGTAGWADVGNLWVDQTHRRRRIATWLLGEAAEWLRLGHVDRLLDYSAPDEVGYVALLRHAGFAELTRTRRGWEHPAPGGAGVGAALRGTR